MLPVWRANLKYLIDQSGSLNATGLVVRILSLFVVVCTIVAAYTGYLPLAFIWGLIILPTVGGLSFIWYPDTLSELTGVGDNWYITNPTWRGCMVAIGWLLLFFPLVLGLILFLWQ